MTYKIQANASGTRFIEVSDDEAVRDKLKFTLRSLLEAEQGEKSLLDLCLDVVYNNNMKAFGLHQLVLLYIEWKSKAEAEAAAEQ